MYDNTILKYHIKLKNTLFNKAMMSLENPKQSTNVLEFNIPLDIINSIGLPNYIEEHCENNVAYTLKQYVNDIYYFNKNTKVIKEIDFYECFNSKPNIIICMFTFNSPEFHSSDLDCIMRYVKDNEAVLLGSFYDTDKIEQLKDEPKEIYDIKGDKLMFAYNVVRGMKICNKVHLFERKYLIDKASEHELKIEFFKYSDVETKQERFLSDDFLKSISLRSCFICKA